MATTNKERVVPAHELVVGDIVEERFEHWSRRKVVTKLTAKSAVVKTDIGQDGRIQFTRKVKGKPADVTVIKVGHRDLSKEELAALREYYSMGEYNRALWRNGLYKGLARFEALFGFRSTEGPTGLAEPAEIRRSVKSTQNPNGDWVEIVLFRDKDYSTPGYPLKETYGARVIDGEHGIVVGYVRGNLKSEDDAEQAADFYLGKRYFDGWATEDALQMARNLSDILV